MERIAMKLWQKLFGPPPVTLPGTNPPQLPNRRPWIEFEDLFVRIPSLDFFGEFAKSPSGDFVLCWCDADRESGIAGARTSGPGRYLLCNPRQQTIVLQGMLERPNDGSVADAGAFCLADWHFGDARVGTFHAFAPSGESLIRRRFHANLINGAIAANGRYAVCQTALNDDRDDGNLLTVFDLAKRTERYRLHPTTEWADAYAFDGEGALTVMIAGLGAFHYDPDGRFLDTQAYDLACLRCDQPQRVLAKAQQLIRDAVAEPALLQEVLQATARICTAFADTDPRRHAQVRKTQGAAFELLGDAANALAAYEAALQIDPKSGVKRKIDALRKNPGAPA
jgi:hypothetical protein